MTDAEVIEGLKRLGLDETNHRLVVLLPLVEVAWVDNEIQSAEREWILDAARAQGQADEAARAVVERWLDQRPEDELFVLATRLVAELAGRSGADGIRLPDRTADTVLELCEQVAAAAGGLFGLAYTVSVGERETIRRIAAALGRPRGQAPAR